MPVDVLVGQASVPVDVLVGQASVPVDGLVGQASVPVDGLVGQASVPVDVQVGQASVPVDGLVGQASVPVDVLVGQASVPVDVLVGQASVPVDGLVGQASVPVDGLVGQASVPVDGLVGQASVPVDVQVGQASVPVDVLVGQVSVPVDVLVGQVSVPVDVLVGQASVPVDVQVGQASVPVDVLVGQASVPVDGRTFSGDAVSVIPIIFFGTPEFACPTLQRLIESPSVEVRGVVTQPDRPRGRGHRILPPPVKALAIKHGVPVLQPESLDEPAVLPWIREAAPEIIVVVAYAGKVPSHMLKLPPKGGLNLHPSLLPRYRGAAPIQWALMNGETETGNSTMYLSEEWDAGDLIYQESEPIRPDDNYGSLSKRLARKGADLMLQSVLDVHAGTAPRNPQDESQVTWARLIRPEHEILDWSKPATDLHNQVRALAPEPCARTFCKGTIWKILRTEVPYAISHEIPGTVVHTSFNTIRVSTGNGVLEILELQPAGKKAMTVDVFLRGHRLECGTRLGEIG